MKLLLDTHALIWWVGESEKLGRRARAAMLDQENEIYVSAVSAFEIATKFRLGKLPEAAALAHDFEGERLRERFEVLDITVRHGIIGGSLRDRHQDPFDRLLIAQALIENLVLVSNEAVFDGFGVQRLW